MFKKKLLLVFELSHYIFDMMGFNQHWLMYFCYLIFFFVIEVLLLPCGQNSNRISTAPLDTEYVHLIFNMQI